MFYRMPEIEYLRVSGLEEALQILSRKEDTKVLAGGTDLVVDMKVGRYKPKVVLDITGVKELRFILDEGDRIRIGALTRIQEIVESSIVRRKIPVLAEALSELGSWQIRNMATIGGNLCNASPAADSAPPLLVHEAKARLTSLEGFRSIPLTEFFLGPRKTVMRATELLYEVEIPYDEDFAKGYSYLKIGRRNSFTLSVVSSATVLKTSDGRFNEVRLALNSVAPTPVRARSVESFLKGKEIRGGIIEEAAELVVNDISPISDVRASAGYRRHVSKVLVKEVLTKALTRLKEAGGD
ncbi:MAG: xanthine dehydrogenase family protein subunit M [Zestosphaera sp.]